jgi:hypothetical protein
MGMLELVVRFRLGRNRNFCTSSSLVTHNTVYMYITFILLFPIVMFIEINN